MYGPKAHPTLVPVVVLHFPNLDLLQYELDANRNGSPFSTEAEIEQRRLRWPQLLYQRSTCWRCRAVRCLASCHTTLVLKNIADTWLDETIEMEWHQLSDHPKEKPPQERIFENVRTTDRLVEGCFTARDTLTLLLQHPFHNRKVRPTHARTYIILTPTRHSR